MHPRGNLSLGGVRDKVPPSFRQLHSRKGFINKVPIHLWYTLGREVNHHPMSLWVNSYPTALLTALYRCPSKSAALMAEPTVPKKDTTCQHEHVIVVTQFIGFVCFKSHLSSKLQFLQKSHMSQSTPFLWGTLQPVYSQILKAYMVILSFCTQTLPKQAADPQLFRKQSSMWFQNTTTTEVIPPKILAASHEVCRCSMYHSYFPHRTSPHFPISWISMCKLPRFPPHPKHTISKV